MEIIWFKLFLVVFVGIIGYFIEYHRGSIESNADADRQLEEILAIEQMGRNCLDRLFPDDRHNLD